MARIQEIRRRKGSEDWEVKLEPAVNLVRPVNRRQIGKLLNRLQGREVESLSTEVARHAHPGLPGSLDWKSLPALKPHLFEGRRREDTFEVSVELGR